MLHVGLHQDGEALEAGTKKFEDLEFQQLERESSLEEERETISQQLLQERAEYHSSVAQRKVRKRLTDCGPSGIQQYPSYGLNSKGFCVRAEAAKWQIFPCVSSKIQCIHTHQAEVAAKQASTIWRQCAYFLSAEATSLQEFNIYFPQFYYLHQQDATADICRHHMEVLKSLELQSF